MLHPADEPEARAEFNKALDAGREIELDVGRVLLAVGLEVKLGPLDRVSTIFERDNFVDEKDVIIGRRHIIEVKSSTYRWRTVEEIRDMWGGLFTCTVERWDERGQKPVGFVIVSTVTRATFFVDSWTKPEWGTRLSRDRRRGGHPSLTYLAPWYLLQPLDVLLGWLVDDEERKK
jgi:hypothetical protein